MTTIQSYTKTAIDALVATLATSSALASGLASKADVTTVTSLSTNVGNMGYVALATRTTDGTAVTTYTDTDTGLTTGSFSVISGRRYKVEFCANILPSVANNVANIKLVSATPLILNQCNVYCPNTSYAMGASMFYTFVASSSGTLTIKVQMALVGGSGNVKIIAGSTYPAYILVTDIT